MFRRPHLSIRPNTVPPLAKVDLRQRKPRRPPPRGDGKYITLIPLLPRPGQAREPLAGPCRCAAPHLLEVSAARCADSGRYAYRLRREARAPDHNVADSRGIGLGKLVGLDNHGARLGLDEDDAVGPMTLINPSSSGSLPICLVSSSHSSAADLRDASSTFVLLIISRRYSSCCPRVRSHSRRKSAKKSLAGAVSHRRLREVPSWQQCSRPSPPS